MLIPGLELDTQSPTLLCPLLRSVARTVAGGKRDNMKDCLYVSMMKFYMDWSNKSMEYCIVCLASDCPAKKL